MKAQNLGNIWTFNTRNFVVSVDAFEDYDMDLSWDGDGSVREQLESGELIGFAVRAQVRHIPTGIESEDWLGGCIYKSLEEFRDHNRNAGQGGSYFADMVASSIAEFRKLAQKARSIAVHA